MLMTVVPSDDSITIVHLNGKLDLLGVGDIDLRFQTAIAGSGKPTIVDLSEVDFIASLGIGLFITCAKSLLNHNSKMVVLSPQPLVKEVLNKVKFQEFVPIADNMDAALRLVQKA